MGKRTFSMKIYSGIENIPSGRAGDTVTDGMLVLEGGGWKGFYTLGVLDAMMENDINISSVIGVSAGALSALGYLSGNIGWGARLDLTYRHDTRYCGLGALLREGSITGFSYLYDVIMKKAPIDETRLYDERRSLIVTATDLLTGRTVYFEKGKCDLKKAVQASATVPYMSRPVIIDGVPYLDGGMSEYIPYDYAKDSGKKIVVVRTKDMSHRRDTGLSSVFKMMYRKYPAFIESHRRSREEYNRIVEEIEKDSREGRIFLIAPKKPVDVKQFESDMDKLGGLYFEGYEDMKKRTGELRRFLGMKE